MGIFGRMANNVNRIKAEQAMITPTSGDLLASKVAPGLLGQMRENALSRRDAGSGIVSLADRAADRIQNPAVTQRAGGAAMNMAQAQADYDRIKAKNDRAGRKSGKRPGS